MYDVETIINDINKGKYQGYTFIVDNFDIENLSNNKYVIYYYDLKHCSLKNAKEKILYKSDNFNNKFESIIDSLNHNNLSILVANTFDLNLKRLFKKYHN